jgi:hypothetical protein
MAQAIMLPSTDMLDTYHHNSLLTRPEARRLTQLEQEMANVLARTDISDKQKMELFSLTLENFRRVRGEIVDKGLMMTSTTAQQPPLKESEDLFGKIQDLIKQLNNPQQQKPPTTAAAAAATPAPPPPPTPRSAIQPTPKNYSPFLTTNALALKKELMRHSTIQPIDNKENKFHIDGTNVTKTQLNRVLNKLTSDDGDLDKLQPPLRLLAHRIYKSMLKDKADISKFTKFKFFKNVAQSTNITPRQRKNATQQPTAQPPPPPTTPANIRTIAAAKKRRLTTTPAATKKSKTGSGTSDLVDFQLWDKH